jgi:NTP pyrophosphatase (non-canonical NTP hydrolase)
MNDATTTVADLRAAVRRFVDEREWQPFHDPKNLSMSIAIEAAELLEHFQWLRSEELDRVRHDAEQMRLIGEELADILCYALSFAETMNIDISHALTEKLKKNAVKYPAEAFRGRSR